ncbi:MAG TPA: hypothetical protein PKX94_08245, partial [Opitutales bacterium]|nr:hypothetical protein [Opitutales bacterium]
MIDPAETPTLPHIQTIRDPSIEQAPHFFRPGHFQGLRADPILTELQASAHPVIHSTEPGLDRPIPCKAQIAAGKGALRIHLFYF